MFVRDCYWYSLTSDGQVLFRCLTAGGHFRDFHSQLQRQRSQEGEYDKTSEETGHAVSERYDHGVAEDIGVELVVAGQGDEASIAGRQREEYLLCSCLPYLFNKLRVKYRTT